MGSNTQEFVESMRNEFRLKQESAESTYEVSNEKDRTIIEFEDMSIGKALFDPNGGRCGGNGTRGGSMIGKGSGWLAKRSIVSNEGCCSGGLAKVKMELGEVESKVEELTLGCSRDSLGRILVEQLEKVVENQ
ncbi:hypothetical protein Tco_0268182 [Tanacetum coccineum]